MSDTQTAHQAWDDRWKSEAGRAEWLEPDPQVRHWARVAYDGGGRRALDLGCGVGRHALYIAELGFETSALDGSVAGIEHVQQAARDHGLKIDTSVGMMTALPYPDGHFDYVLSFNVIYHGDASIVRAAISEIRRVLKPAGLYQGTMLSKRHGKYGLGREIAPDTFVVDGDGEKDHPHHYCNATQIVDLFAGFELLSLGDSEQRKAGDWHWHLVAERL